MKQRSKQSTATVQAKEPVSRNEGLWLALFPLDGLSESGTLARGFTVEFQYTSSRHVASAAPEVRPPSTRHSVQAVWVLAQLLLSEG